jgi:sulfur carrier protein
MTRLKVNGVEDEVAETTVTQLLQARGIDPSARFLAVAVNGAVISRADWAKALLRPGDAVEIVRPLQGG